MKEWLHDLLLRCRALIERRRLERDLAAELEFHLEERARLSGMTATEARRQFGNASVTKEMLHDMWTFRWIEALQQDTRYALRALSKSPGFTVVAVLTLALGIGANTAIFSVVDAVVLRPLPYKEPSRLVQLWGNVKRASGERRGASYPDYMGWRKQSNSFDGMAAMDTVTATLMGGAEPERFTAEYVGEKYFDLLGIRPALGRTFRPEEDEVPQRDAVAILSDALWKRRFGGDPAIVGKPLQLESRVYTIAGVMPPWFRGLSDQADFWVPYVMIGTAQDLAQRGSRGFVVLARLKEGVSQARAQAELDAISKQLERAWPVTNEARA